MIENPGKKAQSYDYFRNPKLNHSVIDEKANMNIKVKKTILEWNE